MAERTTTQKIEAELRIGNNYDARMGTNLQPQLTMANAMTDRIAACAIAKGKTLTDTELEMIEMLLACWFYKGPDPSYSSESTAGASGQRSGQFGMYLEENVYGIRAKALDFSGCLIQLVPGADGKRARAGGFWAGRYPSAQTAYADKR